VVIRLAQQRSGSYRSAGRRAEPPAHSCPRIVWEKTDKAGRQFFGGQLAVCGGERFQNLRQGTKSGHDAF